jgi:hypothetical protein
MHALRMFSLKEQMLCAEPAESVVANDNFRTIIIHISVMLCVFCYISTYHSPFRPFQCCQVICNTYVCVTQGDKVSIIADASTYIKELKQKIAKLSQEMASSSPQHATSVCQQQPSSSSVSVGVLLDKKGRFLVSVFMDESCGPPPAGLLASVLEAFDDIGLTVLEARATCAGSFRLEAVGEVRLRTSTHA